jgi:hypothetical protein
MSPRGLGALRMSVAMAAASGLLALGAPQVRAAPASDGQGYVDSAARCNPPDTAVAFGSTDASRVAICKSPNGAYTYRGVRLRDGAKLILPAAASSGGFAADNDGVTYAVTANALVVSAGGRVIREESMVDFHGDLPTTPAKPTPSTSSATSAAPAPPATPTSTQPLPPPLPAEVGGG